MRNHHVRQAREQLVPCLRVRVRGSTGWTEDSFYGGLGLVAGFGHCGIGHVDGCGHIVSPGSLRDLSSEHR